MTAISEKEYLLTHNGLTEADYEHWQKLTHSMTTSARMMGIMENAFTVGVFRAALKRLMDFEKAHNMQFYELGVTFANAEASQQLQHMQ